MNFLRKFWLLLCFILLTIIFNLSCFLMVDNYTTCFYISIAFGNLSILMYAMSFCIVINKKYTYLSMSNPFVGIGYYLSSTILNFIFILCQLQNSTLNIFINILILTIFLILFFSIFSANIHSVQLTEKQKKQVNNHDNLKEYAQILLNKGKSFVMNKKIENLYDNLCSSEIVENENVNQLNSYIIANLALIKEKLEKNDNEDNIFEIINNTNDLIETRNKIILNNTKGV